MEALLEQHDLKLGVNKQWVSNEKYHRGPGVSNSNLKKIRTKSPLHAKYEKDHPKPATDAMNIGQAFHTLVLEPEHFDRRFAVLADGETYRTKANKEWRDSEIAKGKIVLRYNDLVDVKEMVKSIMANPDAANLLGKIPGTVFERTVYYKDPRTGILCKVKPDILINNPKIKLIVDLKKCEDASEAGFRKACGNYYYDMQAAMYLDGVAEAIGETFDGFAFICCEAVAPYASAVWRATPEMIQTGRENYEPALDQYKECMASGIWTGYQAGINPIDLPMWRM